MRANLRLGAPHATDTQIAGLLADLGLGAWLEQLDAGLDTVLAPWGHPVSGGELQRLSVARAVLADRPVLLLDEPTSHLDRATADAVLATVLDLARSNRCSGSRTGPRNWPPSPARWTWGGRTRRPRGRPAGQLSHKLGLDPAIRPAAAESAAGQSGLMA